jgi:hypothetical protein
VDDARSSGQRLTAKIDKTIAVVVSQVDQLVSEDRWGTLRFRKRPLLSRSADGHADAELVDLPPEASLDLAPRNVRTYLFEHCGDPGRRIVDTLERSFSRVGYFGMSAVGMVREQGESIPNVRVRDGRVTLRDPRALEPIGVLEPLAYVIDPSAFHGEQATVVVGGPTVPLPFPPGSGPEPGPLVPVPPKPRTPMPRWATFIVALGMFTVTCAALVLVIVLRGPR